MKKIINVLMILVGLLILSGCTSGNFNDDPNYVELFPQANSGWYVNKDRPYFVFNDTILIPAVYDDRIVGQWLIGDESGASDNILTITPDNALYINENLVGEWYWGSSNVLITVLYADATMPETTSALRIDFLDDTDDFAQFSEYADGGFSSAFLGVRVD